MGNWIQIEQQQKALCKNLNVIWTPVDQNSLVAFNESLHSTIRPVNGLRHPEHGSVNGWYLWSGPEIPQDNDKFFKSIHLSHLIDDRPLVLKYLGLPQGWRFQIDDDGYEDIWFDETLLKSNDNFLM